MTTPEVGESKNPQTSQNANALPKLKTKICPTCSGDLAGVPQPQANFYSWYNRSRKTWSLSRSCRACRKKTQKRRNRVQRRYDKELWAHKLLQSIRKHYAAKNISIDDRLTPSIFYRLFHKQKGLCALTGVNLLVPDSDKLQQISYSDWYKGLSIDEQGRTVFLVGIFEEAHLEVGKIVLIAKGALGYYNLCKGITRKVDTPTVFTYRDLR